MKTLLEVKDQYAQEQGYENWENLQSDTLSDGEEMENHMNEICTRCQKLVLKKAYDEVDPADVIGLDWEKIHESITQSKNLIQ